MSAGLFVYFAANVIWLAFVADELRQIRKALQHVTLSGHVTIGVDKE
jgi:hypothetical protein